MKKFIYKNKHLLSLIGLFLVCVFVYFYGINGYALMDVDETRYVSMARDMFHSKDYLTLYLNGEYFFEKPPLYFWIECLSFGVFGKINEFGARFPVALCALLTTFLVYLTGKKIVSHRFGIISALILATTFEFSMLARYAILDIVVAAMIAFSTLFGFLTQFICDKNKKYFWWLFYVFSGLAVMAKGIPGFIIPFGVMFFVTIFNKTFKQCFRPIYIIPGFILFSLIVLPWHIIMLKLHNPLFFNEYIMKHHIDRFFSSNAVDRKEPLYFYLLTILWGAAPYILSGIGVFTAKLFKRAKVDFSNMTNEKKFLWFNIIAFCFIFLFFSYSSTKLITYILPIYVFSAYIFGYNWMEYIYENKHSKAINITNYILGSVFIILSISACFTKYFLPKQLYLDIYSAKWFCIFLFFTTGLLSIIFTLKKKYLNVFLTFVIFITAVAAFGTKIFYNIDYKFGQSELINFAKQEKNANHSLYVINNRRKYSVLYYYGAKVNYILIEENDPKLNSENEIFNKNSRAIIKNSDLSDISDKYSLEIIKKGRKYSLVKFNG